MTTSVPAADYDAAWMLSEDQVVYYAKQFSRLQPDLFSFVDANVGRMFFSQSLLDTESLSHIWDLSDVNQDGLLSLDEFCIAMHLSVAKRHGLPLPQVLPPHLAQVAGEVNRIVDIFTRHVTSQQIANKPTSNQVYARPNQVEPCGGQSFESSKSFGFDDDFGSNVLPNQDAGNSPSAPKVMPHGDTPHYQKWDLFQSQQQPVIPPRYHEQNSSNNSSRAAVPDFESPSNPPPSRPPPTLRGLPQGSGNVPSGSVTQMKGNPENTIAKPPRNLSRESAGAGIAAPSIAVEFNQSAAMSKGNVQLLQELKDLVNHRNQIEKQIESLQSYLKESRLSSALSPPRNQASVDPVSPTKKQTDSLTSTNVAITSTTEGISTKSIGS